jgi:hypothetical protein
MAETCCDTDRYNNINKKTLSCDCRYITKGFLTCALSNRMHPTKVKCIFNFVPRKLLVYNSSYTFSMIYI